MLSNVSCAEDDWRQLALEAAHLKGIDIAIGDTKNPSAIQVHFAPLCDFVSEHRSWLDRLRLHWADLASLSLFVGALLTFVIGLR
jgi:hypothetical protein